MVNLICVFLHFMCNQRAKLQNIFDSAKFFITFFNFHAQSTRFCHLFALWMKEIARLLCVYCA